jgi:uncharacterized protein (TIGR03435 family)
MMTDHALPNLKSAIFPLLVATGCITLTLPCSGQGGAKTEAPYVPTMMFAVASVRENKNLDANAGITVSGQFVPHTTRLRAINWTVDNLLGYAYGVDSYQIVGSPKWPWPTMFVIEAKGDSEADAKMAALPAAEQQMEQTHMLQALLEDRFKLKTHWETKEGNVYNLVVAKGGPKLGAAGSMPVTAEEQKNFGDAPVSPIYQKNDGRGYDFIGHSCPIELLAKILTAQFGRPVLDKTELAGKYDFVLKYKGRWDPDRNGDDLDPTPPMDRALQEELGLKVEAAKGPLKVLVIDHMEKPSEN